MKRSQHFGYYDEQHADEDSAQAKYHEEFSTLLDLEPGMRVLDAGCGQGVVACYIASQYDVAVTGVTITPHEVKAASKRAEKMGLSKQANFVLADYAHTPFADASFDRVYTTESLSHAPDVSAVIAEFRRILKPGGRLVCAEYEMDHENFSQDMARLAKIVKDHAAIHGIYQFGKHAFHDTLERHSFKLIREHDWTPHTKPSFDRLRRLARPAKKVAKALRIEHKLVNTAAAAMYSDGVESGVFRYIVYTATK